jgi:hypothetical protein
MNIAILRQAVIYEHYSTERRLFLNITVIRQAVYFMNIAVLRGANFYECYSNKAGCFL